MPQSAQDIRLVTRRIFDHQLYAHFVTFTCYHRRRLLDLDHPRRIVLGTLDEQLKKQVATCVGFVIMPDHVHAIIWFPEPNQLSEFMHGWKRRSSHRIKSWYEESNYEYWKSIDETDPFWQAKYYSFEIYSEPKMIEKLEYIHLNPVRKGLVESATDWKWSSARYYESKRDVGVPVSWIEC